jgi:hypothetical protein
MDPANQSKARRSTGPILFYDLFRGLEIDVRIPRRSRNPFDLRFSLHNPNVLFAINKLEVLCSHGLVVNESERIGEGYNVRRLRTPDAIEPGATIHAACKLAPGAGVDNAAKIRVRLNYRMMFWTRSTTEYFTWRRTTRQWLSS